MSSLKNTLRWILAILVAIIAAAIIIALAIYAHMPLVLFGVISVVIVFAMVILICCIQDPKAYREFKNTITKKP